MSTNPSLDPTDYKVGQGDGPHPTLAGNMLDPGVQADGAMQDGLQQGVGGTSEGHIREEGLEHIKKNTDSPSTSGNLDSNPNPGFLGGSTTNTAPVLDRTGTSSNTSGPVLGSGSSYSGTSSTVPPASNPGYGDNSAGLGSGQGGVSETAPIGTAGQSQGGMMGTVKSYLGMGGQPTEYQEARNAEGYAPPTNTGAQPYTSSSGYDASGLGGDSRGLGAGAAGAGAIGAGAAGLESERGYSDMGRESTIGRSDPVAETAPKAEPADSDVTTGAPPTESADPTTEDRAMSGGEVTQEEKAEAKGEKGGDENPESKTKKVHAEGGGINLENPDSIPSAGGEKLGKKHWGESKMVPDVPPKQESEKGVSSAEGQPNEQTRDNTSKNTGGAEGGPQHTKEGGQGGEQKEGMMDKMKHMVGK